MFDWFFNFVDQAAQNFVIRLILDHAQWVDWFAALFIVLGILYGIQQGMMSEIAEILQIMIVIFLTFLFYESIQVFIEVLFVKVHLAQKYYAGAAYILTGMSIWIVFGLIYKFIRKRFHTKAAKPLHYFGGAILGAFHLIIIFSFLCQSIMLLPYRKAQAVFVDGSSFTGAYIIELAPKIYKMMAAPFELLIDQKKS